MTRECNLCLWCYTSTAFKLFYDWPDVKRNTWQILKRIGSKEVLRNSQATGYGNKFITTAQHPLPMNLADRKCLKFVRLASLYKAYTAPITYRKHIFMYADPTSEFGHKIFGKGKTESTFDSLQFFRGICRCRARCALSFYILWAGIGTARPQITP